MYGEKTHLLSIQKILRRQLHRGNVEGIVEILAQTVHKTLKECGIIVSGDSVSVTKDDRRDRKLKIQLKNATIHDQEIFNKAIRDMMEPIADPRYFLAPRNSKLEDKVQCLLFCPFLIAQKEEYVKIFERYLAKEFDLLEIVDIFELNGKKLRDQYHKTCYIKRKAEKEQDNILFGEEMKYIVVKESKRHLLEDKIKKDVS